MKDEIEVVAAEGSAVLHVARAADWSALMRSAACEVAHYIPFEAPQLVPVAGHKNLVAAALARPREEAIDDLQGRLRARGVSPQQLGLRLKEGNLPRECHEEPVRTLALEYLFWTATQEGSGKRGGIFKTATFSVMACQLTAS